MNQQEQDYLKALGERVRALRKTRGFSQEQLADACQLDRTYIGGIERGERNVTVLKMRLIARSLAVSVAEVFP